MSFEFFLQTLHFAVSLIAALACFATAWLYYDAYKTHHKPTELFKYIGFLALAGSFLIHSTTIEVEVLSQAILSPIWHTLSAYLRFVGYMVIVWTELTTPLQAIPKELNDKGDSIALRGFGAVVTGLVAFLLPAGAAAVAVLFWRRATTGLERHLKPVAVAFGLLCLYELTALGELWGNSSNLDLSRFVAPFGPLWIISHLLLLSGSFWLGRWVWRYLITRLQTQLFMVFVSATIVIFIAITSAFTSLLTGNIQRDSLSQLETAAKALDYAVAGKRSEAQAKAETLASNPALSAAVSEASAAKIAKVTDPYVASRGLSAVVVVGTSGQILYNSDDADHAGGSLSNDAAIRRALIGQAVAGTVVKPGVIAPTLVISSSSPIRDSAGRIVGATLTTVTLDDGFLDSVKRETGLDSALYAGNVRAATTLVAPNGTARWVGVKETSPKVNTQVLKQGKSFREPLSILGTPYLAVYLPVKDVDNTVVGMLFVGSPQIHVLETAGRSLEITFLIAAALIVLAVLPAYIIAKYLAYQVG